MGGEGETTVPPNGRTHAMPRRSPSSGLALPSSASRDSRHSMAAMAVALALRSQPRTEPRLAALSPRGVPTATLVPPRRVGPSAHPTPPCANPPQARHYLVPASKASRRSLDLDSWRSRFYFEEPKNRSVSRPPCRRQHIASPFLQRSRCRRDRFWASTAFHEL